MVFPFAEIFLIRIPALVIAITVHEFAHAWMANRLGDSTARLAGRMTLNPLVHFDPLGTILILLTGFGWAKPTPFNPYNLSNPKKDSALIAVSGPMSNLITATILVLLFRLAIPFQASDLVSAAVFGIASLNIGLAFFNVLPIQPLDGFKILSGILPRHLSAVWEQTGNFGLFILIFLLLPIGGVPLLATILGPVVLGILRILYLGL